MKSFFDSFFDRNFMPHGHCYFWQADILWSHALSDGLIAAAYFTIPLVLLHIFRKRNTTRYIWMAALFAVFITGCGLTHVMDVITIWVPMYRLDALFRIITALASLGTAIALVKITPAMLAIPTKEEWQRTNEELRAANEKLQTANNELAFRNHFIELVTDTMPNSINVFDLNLFKTVYINKNAFETIGYTREKVYAMDLEMVKQLVHPEDLEQRTDFYRDFVTASDQEVREMEFRFRHADGSYRWFLVRGTVFRRNAEGIPDQVIGINQDITGLKETENSLRLALLQVQTTNLELSKANEEIYAANEELKSLNETLSQRNHFIELVNDTIPNIIYVFDLHLLQTIYANKDVFQAIGYRHEELQAMGQEVMKKLVHPEDYEQRIAFQRNFVTARDKEIREVEFRIRHADGSYRWLLLRSTVFRRNAEGIPDQIINISQDITALKETETSLRQTLLQLQTANEELHAANEEIHAANEEINSANEALQSLNETLTQRNHFIERVTDTIPNSIYIFDLNSFKAIYNNKDLPTVLAYRPEQTVALGASVMKKLVHPDDYERRRKYYEDFVTARDNEVREIEFRLKHADGHYRHFLFTNAVFSRNAEGIPDQIIGISQDITPLKQTENELRDTLNELREANEALVLTQQQLTELYIELEERVKLRTAELAESNERFELVARATNDVIWECYYTDHIIQWSPSFGKIFGYLSEEEKQFPTLEAWLDRIHPEDREQTVALRRQVIENGGESWRIEYRFRCADGRYAHILSSALILYDENRNPYRLVGSLMDISPLKEAELALQKRNEELQKINNDLDNFVYAASHDLRHPITNLEGLLMVLHKELNPAPESGNAQWLNLMDLSINRLKKAILDISEISKVQKGLEEAYEELDFAHVLNEIKADIPDLITQSQASIVTDFRVEQIYYARKNLRSILYNLLSNALKYRSPSRTAVVTLSTFLQKDQVVLTVRDNGLGLSEKQQTKLFSMFKRMHDHVEGTGIGLYMIKRIIENNGGKIVAESQPEVGSLFTVYFKINPLI